MKAKVFPYPVKRIGIIGGGQLGKMTAQAAKQMGFYVTVLDPTPHCPAAHLADAQIVGEWYDAASLTSLAQASEVLTYDVEHIDIQTLKQLAQAGHVIYPSPDLLEIIQDKLLQKQQLSQYGIPVPPFVAFEPVTPHSLVQFGFPVVQKARFGGYDGQGVVILRSPDDFDKILPVPSILEQFIRVEKELAIIIARTATGETTCYPIVEMRFDENNHICQAVIAPAPLTKTIANQARHIALQAIESLQGVGIFGVEMFLTAAGQILVNEIAPRPHNSGHYTIEGCITSQFEQLIRIISGLPLGMTTLLRPVVMFNLLGESGYRGTPIIEGLADALAIPGLAFHFYDKKHTRPLRKMGHITILDDNLDQALIKLQQAQTGLKIIGTEHDNSP